MEGTTIKLRPVVCDNCIRNFESTYNVFPNELCYAFVIDVSMGLNFYPLAEVVYGYEQEFFLSCVNW